MSMGIKGTKSMPWEITKFLQFISKEILCCMCWEDTLIFRVVQKVYD